ncbi:hypothetical protein NC653_026547 [Populus alba x Populus x berolinensis]|uniref:Uncharacterized protein n=1 Tax=Populus alba x Populus x berolinensis TaxID=444605 RepID=A0AAD6QBA4_9ROSI|nr:hypothetical protein NC653_026547 [Populus alba x Populus x berolinensis]
MFYQPPSRLLYCNKRSLALYNQDPTLVHRGGLLRFCLSSS